MGIPIDPTSLSLMSENMRRQILAAMSKEAIAASKVLKPITNEDVMPEPEPETKSKYKNRRVTIDGLSFASKKEAKRHGELKLMQKAGKISDLKTQVPFELQPSFKKNGETIRRIAYVADFTYMENGKLKVEDVKGRKHPVYIIKKKLFELRYPALTINEI